MKNYQGEFNITPIRRIKRRSQGENQIDFLKPKDTPELFHIEGGLSQFHNSNSKWNQQMTPVQMGKENLFKLNDFDNKKTPEIYPNRKNSVMTELIKSAAIEEQKEKSQLFMNHQNQNNFYIPEENSKMVKNRNYFENDIMKIKEEQNEDNMSFNSAFENNNINHMEQKEVKNDPSKPLMQSSYQRVLFPSVHSPQNLMLFQSPINVRNSKDKALDMMLECKDFFERSYSKILQSQKKNMDSENPQTEWAIENDFNNKFMIHNFLNSSENSNLPKNVTQNDNKSTFKLTKKRFSFSAKEKDKLNMLNISSQIVPNMSKFDISSNLSHSAHQDNLFINSLNTNKLNQNSLAHIILDAKNDLEKEFMNSPSFSRFANKTSNVPLQITKYNNSSGFFFNNSGNKKKNENSLSKDPQISVNSNNEIDIQSQNRYTIKEIKDALNSNSKELLSNFHGSLGSLSNKKYVKFTNSEKNKNKHFIQKKSISGSKTKKANELRKRNKSSSIIKSILNKKINSGLLFGNSSDQMKLELTNSLIPLNQDKKFMNELSFMQSSNKQTPNQELISPFPSSLSPFMNMKQMPSTAQKTIDHLSKNQSKNIDKVRIGHFTAISTNPHQIATNYVHPPIEPKFSNLKNSDFRLLNKTSNKSNVRMKTPDPLSNKLGKRGGSDAKKSQTPCSFLESDGKNKKKIRNM
jgi:hypothetical protein